MFDAVKNYLALASGFSEVTRQRAMAAAKALVSSGEATAEQVTNLADDLLTTSRNNRDTILALVRYEIDRALARLGLATSEEIAALAQRLGTSSRRSREVPAGPQQSRRAKPRWESPPLGRSASRPAKRATKSARKAPAKRSPAKRLPAKRVAGTSSEGASPRVRLRLTTAAAPAKKPRQPAKAKAAPAKKAPAAKKAPPAKKAPRQEDAPARKAPAKPSGGQRRRRAGERQPATSAHAVRRAHSGDQPDRRPRRGRSVGQGRGDA